MQTKTLLEADGTVKNFFDWVRADGSTEFKPEAGRYQLYGQHLCPFSNRATIGRVIKGLDKAIGFTNCDWVLPEGTGWKISPEKDGCDADPVHNAGYLRELYEISAKKLGASGFSGVVTVPVLYDTKLDRIVSTDSAGILRMFNSEFQALCATEEHRKLDLYPEALRDKIEEVEGWTQKLIGFGVYGPGRAQTQADYDAAIHSLFTGLDRMEHLLSKQRYLAGSQLTEADIRMFVTLVRFDCVYYFLKCTRKRIASDYPALWAFTREIYQTGNVKSMINIPQIVGGYFSDWRIKKSMNALGIIPAIPTLNFDEPHGREKIV